MDQHNRVGVHQNRMKDLTKNLEITFSLFDFEAVEHFKRFTFLNPAKKV